MSENRSKKPQALKEFFSLQDEYDQKELTAKEEKEFEFHRCGGVLFGSLSDLRVDVSEEIDTFAEMEKIASAILELIQKSCVKGIKGITHFISTHIKVDKKESENVWVVDCGILRPAKDSDDLGQQIQVHGACYNITSTNISIIDNQVYIGEVYGPLFGRGASCDLVIKEGIASFENPKAEWIS